MTKNILIFSDGTGQAGGIRFDEDRTNIYKLYRATRCSPDSTIDPALRQAQADDVEARWRAMSTTALALRGGGKHG